jgi:3-oxoadipate enol-lactonase
MMPKLVFLNHSQLWLEHTSEDEATVFIHGFSLDARMWDAQVETFATSYQVIRYDARGFGRSALPSEPYRHADDLHAILEHLHINQATLIGHSMGRWYCPGLRARVSREGTFADFS